MTHAPISAASPVLSQRYHMGRSPRCQNWNKNVTTGQHAAAMNEQSDTYYEIASTTAKMTIRQRNTFQSMPRKTDTPTSTPFPPLKW